MNTCCFKEIPKELPLAGSFITQHMAELKTTGLIQSSFEPPKIIYCIYKEEWKQTRKLLKDYEKIRL